MFVLPKPTPFRPQIESKGTTTTTLLSTMANVVLVLKVTTTKSKMELSERHFIKLSTLHGSYVPQRQSWCFSRFFYFVGREEFLNLGPYTQMTSKCTAAPDNYNWALEWSSCCCSGWTIISYALITVFQIPWSCLNGLLYFNDKPTYLPWTYHIHTMVRNPKRTTTILFTCKEDTVNADRPDFSW